jgi:hypothetical protein
VEGVTEQVQEIVYGVFPWEDGAWEFEEGQLPSREVIVLRMSTGDLILEGIRRLERWSRIRLGVGGLDQRYALASDSATVMGGLSLNKDEVDLVAAIDGVLTLEEICAAAHRPDFQVCRTVLAIWGAGILDRVPQDAAEHAKEHTEPHAENMRGAAVTREIDSFNELHRFLFELVSYELRERAPEFFEKAFVKVSGEMPELFEGVAVDLAGELDAMTLRRNIVSREVARYVRGLDRLLEIESELVREIMGERKAAIIQDGLMALKEQQLQRPARS